jgi:hypothetical protein
MTIRNQSTVLLLFCVLLIAVSFLTPTSFSLPNTPGSIQTAQNTARIGSGTFTVTLLSRPTSGNTLFLTYAGTGQPANPTISSVNQIGVTWAKAISENGLVDVEIWYGKVGVNAGNTATITITGSATSNIGNIGDICEWSNIETTNPLDKTAFNTGLSDRGDTGTTAISSQSNEFFIGAIAAKGLTDQFSATNGYVLSNGQSKSLGTYISLSELVKISTSKETANSGTSFLSGAWAGCIATFKSEDTSSPTATPSPSPSPSPTPTASPSPTPTPTTTTTETPAPTTTSTVAPTTSPTSSHPTATTSPTSSHPTATSIATTSQLPTPTPTVPEFSSAIASMAIVMIIAAALLLYAKKNQRKTQTQRS